MRKGFSLVETIIVVAIITTLLIITSPLFIPEKIKYDQYANSLTNIFYRAKMSAIFNLYNANIIYNRSTGIFTIFIDENRNNIRDSNERIVHTFPTTLDFLRRSRTRLQRVLVFNGSNWINLIFLNQETNIVTFNRLGFAETSTPNTQIIDIYITNTQISNRYRYEYVIRINSGGNIRLIKRNL
ncbi:MAG: prepilin-type N-terminal cleavage/methylation domain-containing protein [Candidatus Calescibacterium sp.]|nr:prepilin-type N-terminal cleavage/methylation domain-containing protein [Candidatus Calescibacterium sp.]MDW8195185.1 prepilin-type N-terminal cleavage/methylation domain-containing protein [Candidatus Calescibacterium sp.]